MAEKFTRDAIHINLSVIREICAAIEVELVKYGELLDKHDTLRFFPLMDKHGSTAFSYALTIMNDWLEESKFKVDKFWFAKIDPAAKWPDMLHVLRTRLAKYHTDTAPLIEVTLSSAGTITREVAGEKLTHDFGQNGLKPRILKLLSFEYDFTPTEQIKEKTKSESVESVSKTIKAINTAIRLKLHLNNFIESKRGSGYRINTKYDLIPIR